MYGSGLVAQGKGPFTKRCGGPPDLPLCLHGWLFLKFSHSSENAMKRYLSTTKWGDNTFSSIHLCVRLSIVGTLLCELLDLRLTSVAKAYFTMEVFACRKILRISRYSRNSRNFPAREYFLLYSDQRSITFNSYCNSPDKIFEGKFNRHFKRKSSVHFGQSTTL